MSGEGMLGAYGRAGHPVRPLMVGVAMTLITLVAPLQSTAQWPFDPAGYLYPQNGALAQVDHVTLLWGGSTPVCRLQAPGLYASDGRVYGFTSLVTDANAEHTKLLFEFDTETISGRRYTFKGQFHNSHVYEEDVKDPREVVASGQLRSYDGGTLRHEVEIEWTYLPKLRSALGEVNVPYPSCRTELMSAAYAGDLAGVRALLARSANVNALGDHELTALECAVTGRRPSAELVRTLIAAGADIRPTAKERHNPLTYGAYRSHPEVLDVLIAAGADTNAASESGFTALHASVDAAGVRTGSRDSVRLLLRAGADVNAKDKSGRTPLSIARAHHDDETVAILLAAGAKE